MYQNTILSLYQGAIPAIGTHDKIRPVSQSLSSSGLIINRGPYLANDKNDFILGESKMELMTLLP